MAWPVPAAAGAFTVTARALEAVNKQIRDNRQKREAEKYFWKSMETSLSMEKCILFTGNVNMARNY